MRYYRPYHTRLTDLASPDLLLGVDCHTMAYEAPAISARRGETRPHLCLSNDDGTGDILLSLKHCDPPR